MSRVDALKSLGGDIKESIYLIVVSFHVFFLFQISVFCFFLFMSFDK